MDECKPLRGGVRVDGLRAALRVHAALRGRVVQVDPIKPMLKLPGTKRLKLEHDGLLSNVGIKFNLRRYTVVDARDRFLKPGGLVLPNVATVHLALLSDQPRYDRSVTFWEDVYGFDFSSLIPQSKRYWSSAGAYTRPLFGST